ncbi:uncharacterized protein (DUF1330 family) [Ulvibacter sp. MAR_2010_11]|uniref:DUF1330 domain-containing protein n=1 Tax=Ulvibacter sp. MAR_2010_11 TaxID=1250229 RepID=UPI000C2C7559|nr:DUF1330 domain-containing protein [Ulvibacter sp. MAR_2010_11]PKA83824.1 uncharacterized protein (DUF1330 family) [Ulvibacter sp. MAR_2010_11]
MNSKSKPGYCLFDNVSIEDVNKLEEYKQKVFPIVEKYNGTYTVIGGPLRHIEGNWKPHYLVMIEFPSYELANKWYDSEEYMELKMLRHSAGQYNAVIMEGF